jgi:hypothetical protein
MGENIKLARLRRRLTVDIFSKKQRKKTPERGIFFL